MPRGRPKLSSLKITEIRKMLEERLIEQVDKFVEKKRRYDDELAADRDQLDTMFGADIVKALIDRGHTKTRNSRTETAGENAGKSEPRTPRRKSYYIKGGLGLPELRPHVEAAVASLKGKEFNRRDVDAIIETKNLKYNPGFVSMILRSMTEDLKETGRRRVDDSGAAPLIHYTHKVGGFTGGNQHSHEQRPALAHASG